MECECGKFIFSLTGEFRKNDQCQDEKGQWYNICPKCGRKYKAKD